MMDYKLIIMLGTLIGAVFVVVPNNTAFAGEEEIEDTIDFSEESLNIEDREVGPLEFTPRWAPVETIDPKSIGILFADCFEDEMAINGVHIFQSSQLRIVESYPVGMPDDITTWVFAIKNNDDDAKFAGVGAMCAEENGEVNAEEDEDVDVDVNVRGINRIVKETIVIREETGDEDIDIDVHVKEAIKIKQNIEQIVNIVNNNNGNGTQIVNNLVQQAAGEDIEQNANIKQFLLTVNPESPTFQDTTQQLTEESRQTDNEINIDILNQATARAEQEQGGQNVTQDLEVAQDTDVTQQQEQEQEQEQDQEANLTAEQQTEAELESETETTVDQEQYVGNETAGVDNTTTQTEDAAEAAEVEDEEEDNETGSLTGLQQQQQQQQESTEQLDQADNETADTDTEAETEDNETSQGPPSTDLPPSQQETGEGVPSSVPEGGGFQGNVTQGPPFQELPSETTGDNSTSTTTTETTTANETDEESEEDED